ncbi:hypothetical protein [Escherichia coli]
MAENIIDKARYGSPELKVSTPNNIVDSVAIIIATFFTRGESNDKKYQ